MTNSKSKNDFLPNDYTPSSNEFMKLVEGNNEIRILSKPLIGKMWWVSPEGEVRGRNEGKEGDRPIRVDYRTKLPKNVPENCTKEFWILKVWDYNAGALKVLELTQQTIIRAINELISSDKWGDPREYDINIKREGSGIDTKYYVMPSPPSPTDAVILTVFSENKTDLNALLSNIDSDTEDEQEDSIDSITDDDLPF